MLASIQERAGVDFVDTEDSAIDSGSSLGRADDSVPADARGRIL